VITLENIMTAVLESSTTLPTRIFKSGNSLSVRIPSSMVPPDVPQDAQIEYKDGIWTIRPIQRRKLTGLAAKFRAFSPSFMAAGRLPQEQKERDWTAPEGAPKSTVKVVVSNRKK
jgi:antitoxin VapB